MQEWYTKAPTPKCVCFYNGRTETEDVVILKLSNLFKPDSKPDIEVAVTMINIITEYNEERTFAEWKEGCIEVGIEKAYFQHLQTL